MIKIGSNLMVTTSLFMFVAMFVCMMSNVSALEYPSPPPVPKKFDSPEEVQRYLNQLHNYYMVVGRPRFGKRSGGLIQSVFRQNSADADMNEAENNNKNYYINEFVKLFDTDGDERISKAEIKRFLTHDE